MLGGNRFLDFADQVIARHRGLGFGFEPAAMLHLENQEQVPFEDGVPRQDITNNLYHIQNIKEENYLFKQNLSFLTQILENKMQKNLYPTVEKQIEKAIREEIPEAENKIIQTVSREMYRLVQLGGLKEFETIREKVLSEQTITEKTHLKEQEQLFRKIENIFNSSIYQYAAINDFNNNYEVYQKQLQLIEQKFDNQFINNQEQTVNIQNLAVDTQSNSFQNYQTASYTQTHKNELKVYQAEIMHPEVTNNLETEVFNQQNTVYSKENEVKTTVLVKMMKAIEKQNELLTAVKNQGVGNLGNNYINITQTQVLQTQPEQQINITKAEIYSEDKLPKLEYPTEETAQFQQEIIRMIHSEVQKSPEIPKYVNVKNISEQILSKFENIGTISTEKISSEVKTNTIHKLSEAILEYAEEKTSTEEFQDYMAQILESYHNESIVYPVKETTQLQQEILQMIQSKVHRVSEIQKFSEALYDLESQNNIEKSVNVNTRTLSEQILSRFENVRVISNERINSEVKSKTIHQLSNAIMEYVEERTNIEEVQNHVSEILENYQKESVLYPEKETIKFSKEILQMIHSEVPKVSESINTKTLSEQILSRFENVETNLIIKPGTEEKTKAIHQLSNVILEYVEEKTTAEELQNQVVQILKDYQTEEVRLSEKEILEVLDNTKTNVFNVETLRNMNKVTSTSNLVTNALREVHNQQNIQIREGIKSVVSEPKFIQAMDSAPMMYRSEETALPKESDKTKQLEKKVNEVVRTLKTVEEKTVIHKEQMIEQQKQVVREVLKNNSVVWTEGEGAGYIKNEVQQSLEEHLNHNVNQIANKVYRQLENKLKSERGRRGLI